MLPEWRRVAIGADHVKESPNINLNDPGSEVIMHVGLRAPKRGRLERRRDDTGARHWAVFIHLKRRMGARNKHYLPQSLKGPAIAVV